mmetsp:Transcript_1523/g.9371  ORF Transcript_1523/g.9371 Transcript_1523/m.9371 type:complete len:286 (-) Transcript_1523:1241-2098(-)
MRSKKARSPADPPIFAFQPRASRHARAAAMLRIRLVPIAGIAFLVRELATTIGGACGHKDAAFSGEASFPMHVGFRRLCDGEGSHGLPADGTCKNVLELTLGQALLADGVVPAWQASIQPRTVHAEEAIPVGFLGRVFQRSETRVRPSVGRHDRLQRLDRVYHAWAFRRIDRGAFLGQVAEHLQVLFWPLVERGRQILQGRFQGTRRLRLGGQGGHQIGAGCGSGGIERQHTREELQQHHTVRVNVPLGADGSRGLVFRRHVMGGAFHVPSYLHVLRSIRRFRAE